MRVKARKVGNSLTVTIPRDVVMEMDIAEDTDMNVFVREGAVVLEPVTSRWERLVERVRDQVAETGVTDDDVTSEIASMRGRRGRDTRESGDESE